MKPGIQHRLFSLAAPRSRCIVQFALAWLLLCATALPQSTAPADPKLYLDDVQALTAPEMEGRGDDTKGLSRAAHMLEQHYRKLGLKPAGTNSYFQPFTVITGARLK